MSDKIDNEVIDTEIKDGEITGEVEVVEAAADTLKPGAAPGESKAETLNAFVSLLAQLGKEDLSNLFTRTLEQIGKEADPIADGSAAKNKASIDAKSVKEDLDGLFSDEELSEDFKVKTSTIFEAAVNTRINLEMANLAEQYAELEKELNEKFEADLEEKTNEILESVTEKLDGYLDYVVKEWMEENKLAVENSLRAEIAEDFIKGLHNLFAEHYIEVPEERVDVFAEMKNEIDELKSKLNETVDKNVELQTIIDEAVKTSIIDEAAEGLTETQAEKLATLAEGVEFGSAEIFSKKLEIIKENYFSTKSKPSGSTGLITEEIDGSVEETKTQVGGVMGAYVDAIKKSVK